MRWLDSIFPTMEPVCFDLVSELLHTLRFLSIDRRARRRRGSAAVDEQLLALDMRGVVGGEEQHRLRDVIGLADAPERRGAADTRFKHLLRFRRGGRRTPDRRSDRARA